MKAIKLILLGVSLFSILPLGAQVFDKPRSLAEADSLDRVQYRVLYQLDFISDPTDRGICHPGSGALRHRDTDQ